MIFYRTMLRVIAVLLSASAAVAQRTRTSWKLKPSDPQMYALKDAPVSAGDREEFYQAIGETVRDERDAIMDFRLGFISLTDDKRGDILVQGTKRFCGATGNCTMWVFVRVHGELQLALKKIGQFLIPEKSGDRGFRDIAIGMHDSATSQQYEEYRWNGTLYKRTDCYRTEYQIEGPSGKQPTIVGCR